MPRCIMVSDVNSDLAEEPLHNACDVLKIAVHEFKRVCSCLIMYPLQMSARFHSKCLRLG